MAGPYTVSGLGNDASPYRVVVNVTDVQLLQALPIVLFGISGHFVVTFRNNIGLKGNRQCL
jgi:hypothetical protein